MWIKARHVIFNSLSLECSVLYSKHVTFSEWFLELLITTQEPVCYVVLCKVLGRWPWWWWCCMLWSCLLPCSSSSQVGLAATTYWACLSNNIIYTATKTTNIQTAFSQFDKKKVSICKYYVKWQVFAGGGFNPFFMSELLSLDLCSSFSGRVCTLQSTQAIYLHLWPNSDFLVAILTLCEGKRFPHSCCSS